MFERKVLLLDQYADPKGFIRGSLMTAAETNRAKAENLEELATNLEKESNVQGSRFFPPSDDSRTV